MIQRGQILIEAMVALAVGVLIITAVASMVISSLSNAQYAKNQDMATRIAKANLEELKRRSQVNWTDFLGLRGKKCINDNFTITTPPPTNTCDLIGPFSREITVDDATDPANQCGAGNAYIISSVKWTDGKCTTPLCHEVKLDSCLVNLNSAPNP